MEPITPLKVGLTGGIGCGKSTVVEVFRQLGVPCFVADSEAHRLYSDNAFIECLREHFGNSILSSNGNIDRKALAQIVFTNQNELRWLEQQIHPTVMDHFLQWASQQDAPYVVFECAILYEHGLERHTNKVVAVYLEHEERIRRLEQRDETSREALEARMLHQLSAEEKMDRADYVVLNYEGNPRQRQVELIHRKLIEFSTSSGGDQRL